MKKTNIIALGMLFMVTTVFASPVGTADKVTMSKADTQVLFGENSADVAALSSEEMKDTNGKCYSYRNFSGYNRYNYTRYNSRYNYNYNRGYGSYNRVNYYTYSRPQYVVVSDPVVSDPVVSDPQNDDFDDGVTNDFDDISDVEESVDVSDDNSQEDTGCQWWDCGGSVD